MYFIKMRVLCVDRSHSAFEEVNSNFNDLNFYKKHLRNLFFSCSGCWINLLLWTDDCSVRFITHILASLYL